MTDEIGQPIEGDGELELWNLKQVLRGQGVRRTTWYELMRSGDAPRPVKVTGKRVAWVKAEVLEYRRQLVARRDRECAVTHEGDAR